MAPAAPGRVALRAGPDAASAPDRARYLLDARRAEADGGRGRRRPAAADRAGRGAYPIKEAVGAYRSGPAPSIYAEDGLGSLHVGKAADVVAAHPTGARLPIVMTVIGGETIYAAV
jgi:predicted amidohydrolase YtcJ